MTYALSEFFINAGGAVLSTVIEPGSILFVTSG